MSEVDPEEIIKEGNVGNTKTTERGGESVVYELKQYYTF
jgi:hypothetical protein